MSKRTTTRLIIFALAILLVPDSLLACPNCKSELHANYQAFAFGVSVLFMMAMPFVLLATWFILAIRMSDSSKKIESESNFEPVQQAV